MSATDDPDARAERDLTDLEQRTERLGDEIADAKDDLVDPVDDEVPIAGERPRGSGGAADAA